MALAIPQQKELFDIKMELAFTKWGEASIEKQQKLIKIQEEGKKRDDQLAILLKNKDSKELKFLKIKNKLFGLFESFN